MAVRQQKERIQPWTTGNTNLCNCNIRTAGYFHLVYNFSKIKRVTCDLSLNRIVL